MSNLEEKLTVLYEKDEIQKREKELAEIIDKDYEGEDEVVIISILKGAVFFTVDLIKNMKTPIILDFMQVSSYAGTETTGTISIKKDLDMDISGKNVLIVEDIVDTGYTLRALREDLLSRNPKSLKIAVLLDKKGRRKVEVPIDYVGYEVENKFVVGYGFDVDERGRNIPYIGCMEE
jgi:hypoxanthine phosphoribosyltransferase